MLKPSSPLFGSCVVRPSYLTTYLIESSLEVSRYDLGGHTHYKLDYHFVWRTKFNRKILGPVLSPFLVDQVEAICAVKHIKLLGLAIAANHVHLCARLRPAHSPAQVMRWLKATTSKNVFERFPQLESRFGIRHLWGRGYHVESLGERPVFAILAYLSRQDEKHDLRGLEDYFATIDAFLTQSPQDDGSLEELDDA
jgi:putative transposase